MDQTNFIVILSTLVFSAFFSGMEIAFVTANKLKIELDGKQGNILSKILAGFVKKPSQFLGVMLVGNNISLVIYGIFMAKVLEPKIYLFIQSDGLVLLIQTIISTVIILITAEFIPKTLFRINPNNILRIFSFPLILAYGVLLFPMLVIIGISEILIKLFAPNLNDHNQLSFGRIDLEHYIREGTENYESEEEVDHEIQIFQNALDFSKVKARECMIPRTEIIAMDVEEDIEVLRQKFVETGLSKILIYRDNIDNIIGYTHSFELFKKPKSIKSILLPVPIIAVSMPANEILEVFIEQRKSIALVVDEFGGTSGILTIEDVIEEIFGEIEDEHDKEALTETQISETEYLFAARLEVDYLNDAYNFNLPISDAYETLGGLVLNKCESIPDIDEEIKLDGFTFTIKGVSDNKIEVIQLNIIDDDYV